MNTEIVKKKLNEHLGKKATIEYSLGRNKVESYDVVIKELYSKVFLVEEGNNILSFSYSDVITKTIKIDFQQKIIYNIFTNDRK